MKKQRMIICHPYQGSREGLTLLDIILKAKGECGVCGKKFRFWANAWSHLIYGCNKKYER